MMTITELSDRLWSDVERVAKYLLPNGKRESHEWVAGSVDGETGKSLKVNLAGKRVWSDFAEGTGGDLLDLWVQVRDCSLHQAMTEAKQFLGITDDDHHFEAKRQKKFSRPKHESLKKNIRKTENGYTYLESRGISRATTEEYKVCDAVVWSHDENRELPAIAFPYKRDGELLQVKRISTERPNGKKVISVEADCEPSLYGWDVLPKDARAVILCEGECWYDTTLGIPYYQRIFGHWPGTQLINAKMEQEALKLPYVQSASCTAVSDANRSINGVMVITDSNFNQMTVNL
ncbi:hypothetical protein [Xenorhabdus hominickii]